MEEETSVIFLDFDGVLLNAQSHAGHADAQCVQALNRITEETGAKIVVSSSWKHGRTVENLKLLLQQWDVAGEVLDKTPVCYGERGTEIRMWCSEHNVRRFVILDDDPDMDGLGEFLVRTNFLTGLTMANAEQAITILTRGLHVKG